MIDLDLYCQRIGDSAERSPTLATLQRLHALHTQTIAFENLDAFSGIAVQLDDASLTRKLLQSGRGGWCYEHNHLFLQVLRQIGFEVHGLAAQVRVHVPDEVQRPRTHMLLKVSIDDEDFIADTGFGRLSLTAPLRLQTGIEQQTTHETFRLLADEKDGDSHQAITNYLLQALLKITTATSTTEAWRTLYRFDLQENFRADYEVPNWYLAHHPESIFTQQLMVARAAPGLRHTLANQRYTVHDLQGGSSVCTLANVLELKQVLRDIFGLHLPLPEQAPKLAARLRALFESPSEAAPIFALPHPLNHALDH